MSFAYPWLLLLIIPALWLMIRRKKRVAVTVPSVTVWPEKESAKSRFLWLPVALRRLSVVLVILAMARPQSGSSYSLQVAEGIAIQLLIDVSSSMDMNIPDEDGKGRTRLKVAKELVGNFIAGDGERLKGRPDDLIGLITFARYADTRSPLTTGHDALLQIVKNLEIQNRPNEDGTAYGDAIALAAARLKNPEELKHGGKSTEMDEIKSKVIILLTDGENNSGSHLPEEAAGLAQKWGCRIYSISLGDPSAGKPGSLSAAEKTLEHLSVETGGIFRKADDYESLLSVYEEIDHLERTRIATRSFDRLAERFWIPLAAGIFSLLLALTLEATWLRIIP